MHELDPAVKKESLWHRLIEPPDEILIEAGASGELLVARIRLLVTCTLLLIPIIGAWQLDSRLEILVGFGVTLLALLVSIMAYVMVSRDIRRKWLGFVTSALDVTLVSGALTTFMIFGAPHIAVNSKVVFEGYFIAIGGTTLRYDARICIVAGLLALGEYAAIVAYAANHWDLNSAVYAPFPYGQFDWNTQISRLIILLTASMLSTVVVLRFQRLRLLSTSDRLTGLFNRGYFDEQIVAEISRAERYDRPLAVAMIDIDHFKQFNDTHGHAAGDVALKMIAAAIRRSFRLSDVVARYGGEEFVVVLPETTMDVAVDKMESIRGIVSGINIQLPAHEGSARLTISAGLACLPADGYEVDKLLRAADARLFEAKRRGRNQLVCR
jgi:two-component system, cell cycle response regulator